MRVADRIKRLSLRDLENLSAASVKLASAAATIQRSGANYVPAVIQLLTEANDTIITIRDRAMLTFQRHIQKLEDRADAAARARAPVQDEAPAGWPGVDEQKEI